MANPWGYGFGLPLSAPNSQVVQSDQEVLQPFNDSITALGNYQAPTYNENFLTAAPGLAATTGLSQEAARGWIGGANSGYASPDDQAFYQAALARQPGLENYYGYSQQAAQEQNSNAMGEAQKALTNKTNELQQNSQRQADAYGQLQGGNYFGGMINEGYSQPFAGQVGAASSGFGMGATGSNPMTDGQSGFGDYKATFNPASQQRRAGQWGL